LKDAGKDRLGDRGLPAGPDGFLRRYRPSYETRRQPGRLGAVQAFFKTHGVG